MSKLQQKYLNANNACKRLEEVLLRDHNDSVVRDSIIKRFEFTVEMCWKLYKVFFEISAHKIISPKDVFRTMLEYEILNDDEVSMALDMIDARNTTAHEYDEKKAEILVEEIPLYLPIIHKMLKYNGLIAQVNS